MSWNNENKNRESTENGSDNDWEQQFKELYQRYSGSGQAFLKQHYKQVFSYGAVGLVVAWLGSGVYIVEQGNRGVVTRFGAYTTTTLPGPHWHFPVPIEEVVIINVENQRFIEVGYRSNGRQNSSRPALPDSLMLTKDENIVSVRLAIQYQINNAKDYLFNVKGNEATLKQVTESIERAVIGRNNMDFILTEGRSQIVDEIKRGVQEAMDDYQSGVRIASVNLQDAQPPEEVQNAFEDAIRAREDKQRLINEAEAYANEVIPKARGAAGRMIQDAEGYEAEIVARSEGESQRFEKLLVEYDKNPSITRKRLYLEAQEKLYSTNNKILVGVENGNNMFYMPLSSLPNSTNTPLVAEPEISNKFDTSTAHTSSRNNRRSR